MSRKEKKPDKKAEWYRPKRNCLPACQPNPARSLIQIHNNSKQLLLINGAVKKKNHVEGKWSNSEKRIK